MKTQNKIRPAAVKILVKCLSADTSRGTLTFGNLCFPCALGKSGLKASKREGDGATPIGEFPLREVLYRPDRVARPQTMLPVSAIRENDGWCDAPEDGNYNRPVHHPYPASAEHMWRADGLYDVVVVLGYNDHPRISGRGSAVFMHVAGPSWTPTEGCIALARQHLLRLLRAVARDTVVRVGA
jgi:L,D-peptidoglycan transpeptidase YkuD (ErfK/YbiS/YcfS/YnhG family)